MSGETNLPFDVISDVEVTRRDRLRNVATEYVYAPFMIVWSDLRARIGGLVLLAFAIVTLVGPIVVQYPEPDVSRGLIAPFQTLEHPLGTDTMGRDLLGMLVHASPAMMQMVLAGAVFASAVGTAVGLLAGYKQGTPTDTVLSTISDVVITIPGLPLTIILMLLIETTDPYLVGLVLSINMWGGLARAVRSEVLKIRHESFVEASAVMGLSTTYIVTQDVLPNVLPYVFMRLMRTARAIIFASVGLYFLGVLPYGQLNWGVILQNAWARNAVMVSDLHHTLYAPMLTIVLFTYGLTLLAQSTDKIFNPRIRARHVGSDEEE